MSRDTKNPAEDKLDALLKTQTIQAHPDFTARTLDRLRSGKSIDERLDALLADTTLHAPASFAEETIRRLRRPAPIIRFAGLAAAAAAVALGFAHFLNVSPTQGHAPFQSELATPSPAAGSTSRLMAVPAVEDPTLSELIALASPLADVAPLLDPDALAALNTLTRWQP